MGITLLDFLQNVARCFTNNFQIAHNSIDSLLIGSE